MEEFGGEKVRYHRTLNTEKGCVIRVRPSRPLSLVLASSFPAVSHEAIGSGRSFTEQLCLPFVLRTSHWSEQVFLARTLVAVSHYPQPEARVQASLRLCFEMFICLPCSVGRPGGLVVRSLVIEAGGCHPGPASVSVKWVFGDSGANFLGDQCTVGTL